MLRLMDGLNEDLQRLQQTIGTRNLIKFICAYGGERIYIPMRRNRRTWQRLVTAVGETAAHQICDHYGTGEFYIPRSRRVMAWSMSQEGWTVQETARALQLSLNMVKTYINDTNRAMKLPQ